MLSAFQEAVSTGHSFLAYTSPAVGAGVSGGTVQEAVCCHELVKANRYLWSIWWERGTVGFEHLALARQISEPCEKEGWKNLRMHCIRGTVELRPAERSRIWLIGEGWLVGLKFLPCGGLL